MTTLREYSLLRYNVCEDFIDSYINRTDTILSEIALDFEDKTDHALEGFLSRLETSLGRFNIEPEALYWMRDNIAMILASSESEEEYCQEEGFFLEQTLALLAEEQSSA